MIKGFLITASCFLVIGIVVFLVKLIQNQKQQTIKKSGPSPKIPSFQTKIDSAAPATGHAILYILAPFVIAPKWYWEKVVAGQPIAFFGFAILLIGFYVIFRMSEEIPKKLFRAMDISVIIVCLGFIVARASLPEKTNGGPASAKPPDQVPTATTHKWQVDPDYTPKCMVWVSNDRFEVALSSNQTIETGVEIPSSGEYSIARVSGGEYFIKKKGKFFGLDRDFISLESLAEGQLILKSKNPVKLRVRLGS